MSAIVVLSKLPIPGQTKTRLIGRMSAEECAAFHLACLKDTAKMLQALNLPSYLYLTGIGDDFFTGKDNFDSRLSELGLSDEEFNQFAIGLQTGLDLGERMSNIFRDLLKKHNRVIVLGADIPGILPQEILQGLRDLDHADLLFGPAEDGGYYLIGMSKYYPRLFMDIPWGTDRVLAETLAVAKGLGLSVSSLPIKMDIDTWEDFKTYYGRDARHSQKTFDGHVLKFMKEMIHKYDESN